MRSARVCHTAVFPQAHHGRHCSARGTLGGGQMLGLWLNLTGLNLAAQVGRRQWERVLEMVRRIRALDMEVWTHTTSQASCFHLHSMTGLPSESMEPSHARHIRRLHQRRTTLEIPAGPHEAADIMYTVARTCSQARWPGERLTFAARHWCNTRVCAHRGRCARRWAC